MISRILKSVDLYGKLPKGLAEPTSSGAIVSMITMVVLTLMIISELIVKNKKLITIRKSKIRNFFSFIYKEYVTIDINTDMYVDEQRQQDKININMNILFFSSPCEFLDVNAFDAIGQVVSEEDKQLKYFRTKLNGDIIEEYVKITLIQNIYRIENYNLIQKKLNKS